MTTFATLEEFYSTNEARRRSPEVDFGVMWNDGPRWPQYRVTWIKATGEVYALELGGDGHVELIGYGGPDREAVEDALEGWAEGDLRDKPLSWVRQRIGSYSLGKDWP